MRRHRLTARENLTYLGNLRRDGCRRGDLSSMGLIAIERSGPSSFCESNPTTGAGPHWVRAAPERYARLVAELKDAPAALTLFRARVRQNQVRSAQRSRTAAMAELGQPPSLKPVCSREEDS